MINNKFIKEIGLLSLDDYEKLKNTHFILFGVGGVGSYTLEALIRAGIVNITIIDKDIFDETNINRQLGAYTSDVDFKKVDVYVKRAKDINPEVDINSKFIRLDEDNVDEIFKKCIIDSTVKDKSIVIDCIDDVKAKIALIKYCLDNKFKIISSMGTSNHLKSDNIKIDKLSKTRYCPLAKKIRNELKKIGNYDLDVLYIDEEIEIVKIPDNINNINSTISYIPAICGLKIAEYSILHAINKK